MDFENIPNFQIESKSGEKYWISRSVAVVVVPFFVVPDIDYYYLPVGKRSPHLQKFPNTWGLVCGYLDWNESAFNCAYRETWEELGLRLIKYEQMHVKSPSQPNFVWSAPSSDEDQVVSLRYYWTFKVDELPALKPQCDEVVDTQWLQINPHLPLGEQELQPLAFNHCEIVVHALRELSNY